MACRDDERLVLLPCCHQAVLSHRSGERGVRCETCDKVHVVKAEVAYDVVYTTRPGRRLEVIT